MRRHVTHTAYNVPRVTRQKARYRISGAGVRGVALSTLLVTCCLLFAAPFVAKAGEPLTTTNYRLDPNVSNSFGGLSSNNEYELLSSGGEAAVGLSDSPSYKLSSGYVEQLEQSIQLNVLPSGLTGNWHMNTGTGDRAYDATTNNNHGNLISSPSWVDGKNGANSLDFPGNSSTYTNHGDSNDQTGSFTLSAWINADDVSTSAQRIIIKDNGTDGWALSLGDGGTGEIRFFIRGASPTATDTDNVISADTWHHIVGVFDTSADTRTIYVDGVEKVHDTGVTGDPIDNSSDLLFGKSFDGTIDEVKIYNKALRKDEVKDQFDASDGGVPGALTLPSVSSSSSETAGLEAVVRTDAGGYDLSIEQTQDLTRTDGNATIPAISSGTISNPDPWNEGSTTGLGFTVTDAVQRDSKWGSSPDFEYAAIPNSSTTFHTRDGLVGGFKETATLEFRIGVDDTHKAGVYQNKLGFTATLKP